MDKIYVVATMDVEPATSTTHATATGPDNWEDGEKFVRGYVARTGEFNFPVSFFIHPEVTEVQGYFKNWASKDTASRVCTCTRGSSGMANTKRTLVG